MLVLHQQLHITCLQQSDTYHTRQGIKFTLENDAAKTFKRCKPLLCYIKRLQKSQYKAVRYHSQVLPTEVIDWYCQRKLLPSPQQDSHVEGTVCSHQQLHTKNWTNPPKLLKTSMWLISHRDQYSCGSFYEPLCIFECWYVQAFRSFGPSNCLFHFMPTSFSMSPQNTLSWTEVNTRHSSLATEKAQLKIHALATCQSPGCRRGLFHVLFPIPGVSLALKQLLLRKKKKKLLEVLWNVRLHSLAVS